MTCMYINFKSRGHRNFCLSDPWAGFKQKLSGSFMMIEQWELQPKSKEYSCCLGRRAEVSKFYCWELLGLRYDLLKSFWICASSSEDPSCPFPTDCTFPQGQGCIHFSYHSTLCSENSIWYIEGTQQICSLNDSSSQTWSDSLLHVFDSDLPATFLFFMSGQREKVWKLKSMWWCFLGQHTETFACCLYSA